MNYKGMPLFNDVEERSIQTNNRAAVMANTMQEHSQKSKVSPRGLSLILGYFNELPVFDRAAVNEAFKEQLVQRGLSSNG